MTSQAFKKNYSSIDWSTLPERMPPPPRIVQRSGLPAPAVIGDTMDAVKSMADGKMYESKSAMRRVYREMGFTEVGNEKQKPRVPEKSDPAAVRDAINYGWDQAKAKGFS